MSFVLDERGDILTKYKENNAERIAKYRKVTLQVFSGRARNSEETPG